MNKEQFEEQVNSKSLPVIVDIWAPWCIPCRSMDPLIDKLKEEYKDRVEVWKINVDEEIELLRELGIMGVPTILGYSGGQKVFKKVGGQTASGLRNLFETVLGNKPVVDGPPTLDRFFRIFIGVIIIGLGWINNQQILLMVIGLGIIFTGVYDRCIVFKTIKTTMNKNR